METDRNLLFGVLALQADLIDPAQFIEACTAWAARKDASLADLLIERGWITPDDEAAIEYLLGLKLKKHADDARKSLAATADEEVRRALAALDDPEIQRSVAELTQSTGRVPTSTPWYQPEARERYTLIRQHDQGGFGRVWLARDNDLGREVALKELLPERAANIAISSRFLEEARITGQLEHPGIVPVYELAGKAGDQRPFYTMRFIRGRTLSEAIRAYHRKRVAARAEPMDQIALLNAFIGACNALAYAHARGVIHRDLKGQNIVLGDYGEVIVLDWGLAKLVDRPEEAASLPPVALDGEPHEGTMQGQALGTPTYMSPEQAEGRLDLVDARSDVYGLGAILYEILTGRPPFDGLDKATVLQRVITEEPPRPSQVCPSAPKALEAICLKAMAKRRESRYPSAAELAREAQRWLADEPVSVYRDPLPVRAWRRLKRHRTLVTSAAAATLVGVVILAGATVLLLAANRRVREARTEAEGNFQLASRAVDRYFTEVSMNRLLNEPRMEGLRKELLASALDFYRQFVERKPDDPARKARLARAYGLLGDSTEETGSAAEAVEQLRRAIALEEGLVRADPGNLIYQTDLAKSYHKLAYALEDMGRWPEGREACEKSLQIIRPIADRPDIDSSVRNDMEGTLNLLGLIYQHQGLLRQAEAQFEEASRIQEQLIELHPSVPDYQRNLSQSQMNLAGLYAKQGLMAKCRDAYRKLIPRQRQLVANEPAVAASRRDLAMMYHNLAAACGSLGDSKAAGEAFAESARVLEQLHRDYPGVLQYAVDLGGSYATRSWIDEPNPDWPAKVRLAERAFDLLKPMLLDGTDHVDARRYLMVAHIGRASGLSSLGRHAEALQDWEHARTVATLSFRRQIDTQRYRTLARLGRDEEAAAAGKELEKAYPDMMSTWRYEFSAGLSILATFSRSDNRLTTAERDTKYRSNVDEAMKFLRKAFAGGYFKKATDLLELTSHPDFQAIREHAEFGQVLAEIKAVVQK